MAELLQKVPIIFIKDNGIPITYPIQMVFTRSGPTKKRKAGYVDFDTISILKTKCMTINRYTNDGIQLYLEPLPDSPLYRYRMRLTFVDHMGLKFKSVPGIVLLHDGTINTGLPDHLRTFYIRMDRDEPKTATDAHDQEETSND